MFLVNFVLEDEDLLEPYEWEFDDCYEEYAYLVMFRLSHHELYDFLYGTLKIENIENGIYIVGDTHYCFVVEIINKMISRRGTIDYKRQDKVNEILNTLPISHFHYQVLQRACEKELGLTRNERLKKLYVEELLSDSYYFHEDVFNRICDELMIKEKNKEDKYHKALSIVEKGYSSIHEILYNEYISKKS
jgi:hypothetical protein